MFLKPLLGVVALASRVLATPLGSQLTVTSVSGSAARVAAALAVDTVLLSCNDLSLTGACFFWSGSLPAAGDFRSSGQDDLLTSARAFPGIRCTLFADPNQGGASRSFVGALNDLRTVGFDDTATSFLCDRIAGSETPSQYLSLHNNARAAHGAVALTWNDDLAIKAQQWADNCVFAHSGGTLGRFGENLAAGTSPTFSATDSMNAWMAEASQFNPGNPQPSHFTQVVWKASRAVGCAVQACPNLLGAGTGTARFYVCEYDPPGNVIGQFPANVQ